MSYTVLLFYLFFTFMRPQDWVPAFYGKPIVDILTVLNITFLSFERLGQKKGLAKVPQNFLIFGLFFAIIMSHVSHTYLGGAIYAFQSFVVIFILFFLLLNTINSGFKYKTAIWFIILLIVILVPQGIYQMEHGYGWAGQPLTVHQGLVRINWIGIFNDPNDLALIFVIAVGLLLAFAFGSTNFALRTVSFGLLAALLYGIFLTNSRGGLLALMATIYFFFVRRTRKFFWGGILGGLMGFAVLTFGPSRGALINVEEASAFGRVELWYQGIMMMKSNPLFGVGYGMFMESLPQTAHNSYILAGAELGLIGLFFFIALIYSSFVGLSTIQDRIPKYYNYALGLQSGLVGFSTAAFFLSRTYIILPYMLFALSGSLMYVVTQENPDIKFKFTKRDARNTFMLSLGIILLSYLVIRITL